MGSNRKALFLVAALMVSSCASIATERFGGNPVSVAIEIRSSQSAATSVPTPATFPVRAWVLNTAGLKKIGGRIALTNYATDLEFNENAESVKLHKENLITMMNAEALLIMSNSVETVSIETKLHTMVVEDGQKLLHTVMDVVRLDAPYKFQFDI